MNYVFIVVLPTNTIKFILNQRITELWPICRHRPICVTLPYNKVRKSFRRQKVGLQEYRSVQRVLIAPSIQITRKMHCSRQDQALSNECISELSLKMKNTTPVHINTPVNNPTSSPTWFRHTAACNRRSTITL